jgi:hypothetical protein
MAPKLQPKATPPTPPAGTNGYAPSVPISVYRQLASELETLKAQLIDTTQKNQQLTQQNQQLRQALTTLVQSAMMVQPLVGGTPSAPPAAIPSTPAASPSAPSATAPDLPNFDEFFSEQPAPPPVPETTSKPRNFGGLWLTIVILGVMLTAFGAGFIVVRPMLQNNDSR